MQQWKWLLCQISHLPAYLDRHIAHLKVFSNFVTSHESGMIIQSCFTYVVLQVLCNKLCSVIADKFLFLLIPDFVMSRFARKHQSKDNLQVAASSSDEEDDQIGAPTGPVPVARSAFNMVSMLCQCKPYQLFTINDFIINNNRSNYGNNSLLEEEHA